MSQLVILMIVFIIKWIFSLYQSSCIFCLNFSFLSASSNVYIIFRMRLTIQLVPLLLLILLPLLQWAGYITSLLAILASLILILCVR